MGQALNPEALGKVGGADLLQASEVLGLGKHLPSPQMLAPGGEPSKVLPMAPHGQYPGVSLRTRPFGPCLGPGPHNLPRLPTPS